jgi:hypothetical protein
LKQGKFEKAERAHWRAFGLWWGFSLFRQGFIHPGFDSNLWYLGEALMMRGDGRLPPLKQLRRIFKTRFMKEEKRRNPVARTSVVGTRWN